MLDDRDIWRSANVLIKRYGDDAGGGSGQHSLLRRDPDGVERRRHPDHHARPLSEVPQIVPPAPSA